MSKPKSIPKLNAVFYKTEMGVEPVRDWLLSVTKEERRQIGEDISYVQFYKALFGKFVPHTRRE